MYVPTDLSQHVQRSKTVIQENATLMQTSKNCGMPAFFAGANMHSAKLLLRCRCNVPHRNGTYPPRWCIQSSLAQWLTSPELEKSSFSFSSFALAGRFPTYTAYTSVLLPCQGLLGRNPQGPPKANAQGKEKLGCSTLTCWVGTWSAGLGSAFATFNDRPPMLHRGDSPHQIKDQSNSGNPPVEALQVTDMVGH